MRGRTGPSGAALVMLGGAVWSVTGLLSKWVPWSPYSIIGVRSLLAYLAFGLWRGTFRLKFGRGVWLGAAGMALTSALFILANKMTTAANAVVLHYVTPIVVIFAAWVFYGQRPARADLLAAGLALTGIVLCFLGGLRSGGLAGDLIAILSAFSFAMVFFASRMEGTDAADFSILGSLISCVFLLYLPFDRLLTADAPSLTGIVLLGASQAGGYIFLTAGMRKGVHPVTASVMTTVEPVLSPLWVFLVLGEYPGALSLLGAALVILSVTGYGVYKSRAAARAGAARAAAMEAA
ncbi:MAG TPA: DMT family transporter [Candidatus Limnocylindria bacterium]|nr:DMT family transporter [Candidatus Limnocylindria bacterium]